jgi:hypothetical protein
MTTTPQTPMYQMPWSYSADSTANILNTLQHQGIVSSNNNNTSNIVHEITAVDKHLSDGVLQLSGEMCASTSKVVDTVGSQSLGLRDAIERTATNLSTQTAGSVRDTQVAIERNGANGSNTTERVGSNILATLERTSGENRLSTAVYDAANRQNANDLARDIISQNNRDASDIQKSLSDNRYTAMVTDVANRQTTNDIARDIIARINDTTTNLAVAVEKTGNANQILLNSNGYETRTLLNDRSNIALLEASRNTEKLSTQGLMNYSSILLEQQRSKEILAKDLADAKYESLRNKELIAAQMATGFSDNRYESLKNTHLIAAQLEECCCGLKTRIGDVESKLEDTLRTLDSTRIRDSLNNANNEINLLKVLHHTQDFGRRGNGNGNGNGGGV